MCEVIDELHHHPVVGDHDAALFIDDVHLRADPDTGGAQDAELFLIHLEDLIELDDTDPEGFPVGQVDGTDSGVGLTLLVEADVGQTRDGVAEGGAGDIVEDLHEAAFHLITHHVLPPAGLVVNLMDVQADDVGEERSARRCLRMTAMARARPSGVISRLRSGLTWTRPSRSMRATV